MNKHVEKCREFIESRAPVLQAGAERQLAFWKAEKTDRPPLLLSCAVTEPWVFEIPDYNTKATFYDVEKMLTFNMKSMLSVANGGMEAVPSGRANMGCGIYPTIFPGIHSELFDDKMPWIKNHLDKKTISKMDAGSLVVGDDFKMALEHMAKLGEYVRDTGAYVFPPDLQGPFDTAHLVYGDDIFYDIFDDKPFLHHLMELSLESIKIGMEQSLNALYGSDRLVAHYNSVVIPRDMGGLKISEDTSTIVSPDTIDEFIIPYTRRVLAHFGGGYIHYCGKNDYLYKTFLKEKDVIAINFGNPEKHDMEEVLRETAQAGKLFYGGMPRGGDMPWYDYFIKYLKPSYKDRVFRLLMPVGTGTPEMREQVEKAFYDAVKTITEENNV